MEDEKKWNKKGMLIQTWIIAFLIFTSIFALMFLASQGFARDYGADHIVLSEYEESYAVFDNVEEGYGGLFTSMSTDQNQSFIVRTIFGEASIINAMFSLVDITFGSVEVMNNVATDFISDFGVPEQIANVIFPLFSAIIVIILIFGIINAVNRGNRI